MVPFVASFTENPLFTIVGLVLTFIKIDLLAIVAELLAFVSEWAHIAEPGVAVSMKLATGPESFGLEPSFHILFRTYWVFTKLKLFNERYTRQLCGTLDIW